jgi:hypothetical protein
MMVHSFDPAVKTSTDVSCPGRELILVEADQGGDFVGRERYCGRNEQGQGNPPESVLPTLLPVKHRHHRPVQLGPDIHDDLSGEGLLDDLRGELGPAVLRDPPGYRESSRHRSGRTSSSARRSRPAPARRTRHTTTEMINRYDHAVGVYSALNCGMLLPLHEAIPELAAMEPSDEWKKAGLAPRSEASIVGESSAPSMTATGRS